MKKFKRIAALVAAGLLGVQMLGVVPALAANTTECDFGSDNLEITVGDTNVSIGLDEYGMLFCDDGGGNPFSSTDKQLLRTLKSITAEMDNEDATGTFELYLDDNVSDYAQWSQPATFDLDVVSLWIDASAVSYNNVRVAFGSKSVTFNSTTATTTASHIEFYGSSYRDFVDGTKTSARLWLYGNDENDTLIGGPFKDYIEGNGGLDKAYGGPGNDYLDCGNDGSLTTQDYEYGWGQDGDDYVEDCEVTAPGLGDDYIDNDDRSFTVTYEDVKAGMTYKNKAVFAGAQDIVTSGGAGDDQFDNAPKNFKGTQGDDVIIDLRDGSDDTGAMYGLGGNDYLIGFSCLYGGPGNDRLVGTDTGTGTQLCARGFFGTGGLSVVDGDYLSGGPGNDTLVGKGGNDFLAGGGGSDTIWGGGSVDICVSGVVNNDCELIRTSNHA